MTDPRIAKLVRERNEARQIAVEFYALLEQEFRDRKRHFVSCSCFGPYQLKDGLGEIVNHRTDCLVGIMRSWQQEGEGMGEYELDRGID